MIERASIIEEPLTLTEPSHVAGTYFLSVLAEMDDEAGLIEVEISIISPSISPSVLPSLDDQELAHVKVKAQITNPLGIVEAYLLKAAAHYGLCVGAGLIHDAGRLCLGCYQESQMQMGTMPLRSRCRDVFRRLRGKSQRAKEMVTTRLSDCALDAIAGATIL